MENKANNFIKNEVLKMENRTFLASILGSSIGYLLITLWLNSIRTTASLWFVWVLIIIQFALYFSIFISGYNRSKVLGLNKNLALVMFIVLAVLGRINDWEIVVIPLLVITMLAFSARNKKVSEKGKTILPKNDTSKNKIGDLEIKNQLDLAETLYKDDPDLAMRIAMGEEKAPAGILAEAVYTKVCDKVEKAKDISTITSLINSDNNSEISKEAQNLNFRNPDQVIEIGKDVRASRIKNLEKELPAGETFESAKKKLVEELKNSLKEIQKEQLSNLSVEKILENLPIGYLNEDQKSPISLEEAQSAVDDYSGFLADCVYARLHTVFLSMIPESLLPYSPQHLEDAINVVAKHYHEKGDAHKVKLHHEILAWLTSFENDEIAIAQMVKNYKDEKWRDMIIEFVKNFRTDKAHKDYIENYKKFPLQNINFEKLDIPTAYKIIKIFSIWLKYHMLFSILFSKKIPEGFLPFEKEQLFKAIDVYINTYKSIEHENAETYAYAKTIIKEDYIGDEEAVDKLMKNLANPETRNQIISELKEYQIKTARTKYIDRLGLTKKIN